MERIPTTPTSAEPVDYDELLREILSSPSNPAILIEAIAEQLEDNPFLVANWTVVSDAIREASAQVLEGLPEVIVTETIMLANMRMPLPYPGEQAGPYAARLYTAARYV
jgi:hypothetical protein